MKKKDVLILMVVGFITLLIITKPYDEACKKHFSSDARTMSEKEFFLSQDKQRKEYKITYSNPSNDYNSAISLANSSWETCFTIKDRFLFKSISVQYIDNKAEHHYALLNTFF